MPYGEAKGGQTYESATSHAFFIFSSLLLFTLARTMACGPSAASPVPTAFLPLPCSVNVSKTSAEKVAVEERRVPWL